VCATWLTILAKAFGNELAAVPLLDVLKFGCGHKPLVPLVSQLVHNLALHIEKALGLQVSAGHAHKTVSLKWVALEDIMSDGNAVARRLAEYVASSVEVSACSNILTIATDKASIKALPMTNSVIVYPNNRAVVCFPQVVLAGDRVRISACRNGFDGPPTCEFEIAPEGFQKVALAGNVSPSLGAHRGLASVNPFPLPRC
jgi:hypothetical protein